VQWPSRHRQTAALGSLGYNYDSVGQLGAQTVPHAPRSLWAVSTNGAFDDSNRQTKANNIVLSYVSDGSLISDGSRTYVFDDRNRLISIKFGSMVIASFSYDASYLRIARTEGGTTAKYRYDGIGIYGDIAETYMDVLFGDCDVDLSGFGSGGSFLPSSPVRTCSTEPCWKRKGRSAEACAG
jgi:hypothetical protein